MRSYNKPYTAAVSLRSSVELMRFLRLPSLVVGADVIHVFQLPRIVEVVPHAVEPRGKGTDGIQQEGGCPNGKDRVFLPHALTARDGTAATRSDPTPQRKLCGASQQRDQPHCTQDSNADTFVEDVADRDGYRQGEGETPETERKPRHRNQTTTQPRTAELQEPCRQKRQKQQRKYLAEHGKERGEKLCMTRGVKHGHEKREQQRGEEIGEQCVGSHELRTAAQPRGHYGGGGAGRTDEKNSGTLPQQVQEGVGKERTGRQRHTKEEPAALNCK